MFHDSFSSIWFETFLDSLPEDVTASEVAFVTRYLPPADFPHILDVACGSGRHAAGLVRAGYKVLGIDKDAAAVAVAQAKDLPGAEFSVLDMRQIVGFVGGFDGAVNLWHSFGYYDSVTNATIIQAVADALRNKGRAIFDLYNRDHMRTLPSLVKSARNGIEIETQRTWKGNRLRCEIRYPRTPSDILEWYLYSPDEFSELLSSGGFRELKRSAWFDETIEPSAEHARMQFIVEKR